jgi:hypothetical protein
MTTKAKTQKTTRPYNTFFAWLPGASLGFVAFKDDNGDTMYELSLLCVRFVFTKNESIA